jgi:quercetin dioxygenase-like cupin family protein
MNKNNRPVFSPDTSISVEVVPGLFRTTLAYNEKCMMCYFRIRKGISIPSHCHEAVQSGYILKGRILFRHGEGDQFIAEKGWAYAFDSNEMHSAEILDDSEIIECFAPLRPEYI